MSMPWETTQQHQSQNNGGGETKVEQTQKRKQVRKATRNIEKKDFEYLLENYKEKSMEEMMKETGLTEFQIRRAVQMLRKILKEKAGDDPQKKAKAEQIIKEKLTKVSSREGGSDVKESANSIVDDILNGL